MIYNSSCSPNSLFSASKAISGSLKFLTHGNSVVLLMTTLSLHGSGFQIDSKVCLHINTVSPAVISLNLLRSSGRYRGSLLSFPMTRFEDIAAIIHTIMVEDKY